MGKYISKKQNNSSDTVLIALVCVLSVAVICVGAIIIVMLTSLNKKVEFIPPEFETQALQGSPTVPDGMGYLEVYKEGMSFNSFVCGEVNIVDGKADIYFTNPEKNTLWMKLRIFDEAGNIIAETGLIKPNEYLKTITFTKVPKNNSKIIMKIMTYEPNTYYSGGAVSLTTVTKVK